MKSISEQFYSQLREATFANELTVSELSQRQGVHYTYVYNSIRNNSNLTFKTAEAMARAAGYAVKITYVPVDGQPELVGNLPPVGDIFSQRRAAPVKAPKVETPAQTTLDQEIDQLLGDA